MESLPAEAQRISAFIPAQSLSKELQDQICKAEDTLYQENESRSPNRNELAFKERLAENGFNVVVCKKAEFFNQTILSKDKFQEWFAFKGGARKTYAEHLSEELSTDEINQVKVLLQREISEKMINWRSVWLFVKAISQL